MLTRGAHSGRSRHGRKFPTAGSVPSHSIPDRADSVESRAKQLRIALEALGPRYSCLALYLSSRIDLLPAEYCRELALADDAAPPLSPAEVRRVLMNEFGAAFSRSFDSFEYEPQNSSLTRQSHLARLTTGDAVTVTFLRPEYYALQDDQALGEFLDWEIIHRLCGETAIENTEGDFLHALRRKVTLSLEREALEGANQTAFDPLRVRRIYRELSTPRVLTLEKMESTNLNQSLASHKYSRNALARRICKAWLGQAMSGNPFPVDPLAHHLVIGKNDQLFFEGCELASLPKGIIENLWNYLLAALIDDPDRSATHLLQEMISTKHKEVDLQSFRTNFRQAAYFAALEPVLGTDSNALAQLIFQHWRTALDHGYLPKPRLLCFYRGFFSVARIAWKVSATDDSMREGMEDLQTEKIFDAVRELAGTGYWMQNADKFANALVNLPTTLDQALTRTSHPAQEIVIQNSSDSRPRNVAAVVAIFLLIVAVLVAESSHLSGASGKIVTGVLMLAGLLALRASSN